jgi:hypothetical protein
MSSNPPTEPADASELERLVALTDPRQVIVAVLRRMRAAGESHEMAARWIMEELHKHGFEVISNGR